MVRTRTVLVTGASTGIGLACAERFDRLGWQVFAGARRDEDLERLAELGSGQVRPVRLDVTRGDQIAAVVREVGDRVGASGLDLLVNNAGVVLAGPLEFLPLEAFREVQEINVVGTLAVTQACLPLIRRGGGRIVNIGSISGRVANPFVGAYAASKFAVEALSDSLRVELAPWGLHVALIEPGMIQTPIWSKSEAAAEAIQQRLPAEARALYGPMLEAMRRLLAPAVARAEPAARVADAVEHAATSAEPRTRYVVGKEAWLRLRIATLLPDRLRDRLMLSLLRRYQEAPQ